MKRLKMVTPGGTSVTMGRSARLMTHLTRKRVAVFINKPGRQLRYSTEDGETWAYIVFDSLPLDHSTDIDMDPEGISPALFGFE